MLHGNGEQGGHEMAGTELATAFVQIIPTAKNIQNELTELLSNGAEKAGDKAGETSGKSFMSKLGSSLAGGAKAAAGAAVTALGTAAVAAGSAAVAIGKSALDSYANYEQLAGGITKLYGDASDQMMQYANQAYLTSGKSANEYMETATSFSAAMIKSLDGDTAKAAELTDVAMRAIADNVSTFGSDAAAVESAISGLSRQNYTMLDNLKLGYAGSAEGMMQLINDSGVLGETLTNTSELANVGFDKMIEAIAAVQDKQGIAGATASEALKTIEGAATATKSAWENVLTAIGRGEGISEASSGLITAIFGTGDNTGLINRVLDRVKPIMEGISTFLIEAAPVLLDALSNVIGIVADTLPGTIVTIIPVVLQAAGNIVQTLFGYLMENLPTMMAAGISLFQSIISGISSNLPSLLETGISMLTQFLSTVAGYLPDLLVMGGELLLSIIRGLVGSIPDLLSGIGEILQSAWDAFVNYDWLSLGKAIIDGIVAGISNFGSAIGNKLREAAGSAFKGIKNFFGIESPSKLMRDQIGRYIPEGIAVGIEANTDSVTDAMRSLSDLTVSSYDTSIKVPSVNRNQINVDAVIDEVRKLKEAITGMQIILDTGATVGGLAPAMDAQLGSYSVYKGRGN